MIDLLLNMQDWGLTTICNCEGSCDYGWKGSGYLYWKAVGGLVGS